jgi:serine/threonine-protein phosphatase Stp1
MGTTVAVLGAEKKRYFCLWAGDSRIYRLRDGKLDPLTRDHRYIDDLLASGEVDEARAKTHPLRNALTRAIGCNPQLELDCCAGSISPGDVFLLVTDGITAMCNDRQILDVLSENAITHAADAIVRACLERGAPDNLTLILLRVEAR